jgi:hypothetical protein
MYMYTGALIDLMTLVCDNQDIRNEIENQAYINAFVNTSIYPLYLSL